MKYCEEEEGGGGRGGLYLLSGAVWMIQVDGDLTLACTEGVHREHSRSQHSVSRWFNTCTTTQLKS